MDRGLTGEIIEPGRLLLQGQPLGKVLTGDGGKTSGSVVIRAWTCRRKGWL